MSSNRGPSSTKNANGPTQLATAKKRSFNETLAIRSARRDLAAAANAAISHAGNKSTSREGDKENSYTSRGTGSNQRSYLTKIQNRSGVGSKFNLTLSQYQKSRLDPKMISPASAKASSGKNKFMFSNAGSESSRQTAGRFPGTLGSQKFSKEDLLSRTTKFADGSLNSFTKKHSVTKKNETTAPIKVNNFLREDSKASEGFAAEAELSSNINVALYNSLTTVKGAAKEQPVKYENYDSSGGTKDDEAVSGANSSAAPARKPISQGINTNMPYQSKFTLT